MDDLPPEILCLICEQLEHRDLPAFRLVNKTFADIGIRYLCEEVITFLHDHDFERLLGIADHDLLRKNVREVFYRAHLLDLELKPYKEWQRHAENVIRVRDITKMSRGPRPRTKAEWRAAYMTYQETHKEQSLIREHCIDAEIFARAFSDFENMEKLTVDIGYRFDPQGDHTYSPFVDCLDTIAEQDQNSLRELCFVVAAVCNSGRKLREFQAGSFHWSFFAIEPVIERFIETQKSTLTVLRLDMINDLDENELTTEADVCSEFWKETKALSRFLAQFPNLQTLDVRWDGSALYETYYELFPARFEDVVEKGQVWPSLKEFAIGSVTTSESELLDFFEAHKATLKSLEFQTIDLSEGDSWRRLLPRLQKMLTLDHALIYGRLYAPTEHLHEEQWDIADARAFLYDEFRDVLADYMVNGGECPLTEDNMNFTNPP